MFSYEEFKSSIRAEGLARQNRFYVDVSPPKSLVNEPITGDLRRILLRCKSVSVPGVSVSTSPERLVGEQVEKPYDRNFGPATMTFYMDQFFAGRTFFEQWIDSIQNSKTRTIGWYDDFVSREINVNVLDLNDQLKMTLTLHDAHPKMIGQMQLDNSDAGVMTFDVTFDYHYYTTKYAATDAKRQ
jgi:hypothetical protein